MTGPQRFENIRERLLVDFSLAVRRYEVVGGGLDPDATVWKVDDDRSRTWAVKWTRRDNRFGLRLAASLARDGVRGVPRPRESSAGTPWVAVDGGRLSVTEWVGGEDAFEEGLTPAQWASFGRLIRSIHDHRLPLDETASPGFTGRRGIRRAGTHVRRRITEVDRLADSRLASDPGDRVALLWKDARPRVQLIQDHAALLRAMRDPAERVPCHGDPHLGNVILDGDGQPWLIDFDDAVWASKEVDLMLVELGVLTTKPISEDSREAFREGYGPTVVDETRVLRFGCIRAVEDLVETAHELLSGESAVPMADLEELFVGILSEHGLAGIVKKEIARS